MKTHAASLVILSALLYLALPLHSNAGLSDFLKGLGKGLEPGALSEDKIVRGLKEALEVGTKNAVSLASKTDGYYGNPEIRIPLPETLRKVERVARGAGYGSTLDAFQESMNRAAERAAPHARSLLWEAVSTMTIQDARGILNGPDDAATTYLKGRTFDRLTGLFKPEVRDAMSRVDVTRRYQELTGTVSSIPFVGDFGDLDLDAYVTERALDGLFLIIANEERDIRENPTARVTELLKDVFGSPSTAK